MSFSLYQQSNRETLFMLIYIPKIEGNRSPIVRTVHSWVYKYVLVSLKRCGFYLILFVYVTLIKKRHDKWFSQAYNETREIYIMLTIIKVFFVLSMLTYLSLCTVSMLYIINTKQREIIIIFMFLFLYKYTRREPEKNNIANRIYSFSSHLIFMIIYSNIFIL